MWVHSGGASALSSCTLRIIFNGQGPDAARRVLESFGSPSDHLRQHAITCPDCSDIVREFYGDGDIPVTGDYLTDELKKLLKDLGE